jgi:phosphomannomutase
MNNNFDIIAFDLDGTLAESKAPLDTEMAGLLGELLKQKKVAVVSGASFSQFQKQFLANFSSREENMKNVYLLPTSGASLYEYVDDWRQVYEIVFSPEERKKVLEAFETALKEGKYIKPDTVYGALIEDRGSQITFSACGQEAPIEIKKTWDPDRKKRDPIVAVLQKLIPEFSITMSATTSIDVTKKGIDKAYGLTKLMEYLNCPKDALVYVGDALFPGGNDSIVLTLGVKCMPVSDVSETKKLIRDFLPDNTLT